MKHSAILALLVALLPCIALANPYTGYYKDMPVQLTPVTAPLIPAYQVNIKDFGGVNDGVTLNSEAFAKAMAHLQEHGGGHLVVPEGIWYTGPITFVDNVDLHLDRGAFLLFSSNLSDYPLIQTSYEGLNAQRCLSPLNAVGRKNISITGHGTINGNGHCWRPVKRGKMTDDQWRTLTRTGVVNAKGTVWYPNANIAFVHEQRDSLALLATTDPQRLMTVNHDALRPVMLSFVQCENVMLQGVTFENSPAWNLHPLMCRNIIIDGVNVRNPWYAQNGDGIDLESCTDALIVNSTFDVGDDAICIKSGKDKDGRERGIPCRGVLIDGCTVYHGHGGFVIGSEMSGGCKDIVVRNCVFDGTDVGLRFKSTRGRGGVVENIHIDGIKMYNIAGNALIFNLYYGGTDDRDTRPTAGGKPQLPPVTEETPSFRDIYMSHVVCQSAARAALFNGLPEMPIKNIVINDSRMRAAEGFALSYVDGLTLNNVVIDTPGLPIEIGRDVTNLEVNDRDFTIRERHIRMRDGKDMWGMLYTPTGVTGKLPTVLLAHGYNSSYREVEQYAEDLARHGFAAYIFDFCGGGNQSLSDGVTTEMTVYTERENVLDVVAAVKTWPMVDTKRLALVGCSQGALVTALTSSMSPKLFKSIVLVYPALTIPQSAPMVLKRFDENPGQPLEVMGMDLGRCYYESINGLDIFKKLGAYKGNVLIVYGDQDPITPEANMQRAKAAYRNCRVVMLAGAGHGFPAPHDKRACADAITKFMTETLK